MANTVKISSCELINADCLEFIRTLPENSVDLIVTDPPYFKVKPEGWDNQWKGDDDYLQWLDQCLAQFWRVLKPAGLLNVLARLLTGIFLSIYRVRTSGPFSHLCPAHTTPENTR